MSPPVGLSHSDNLFVLGKSLITLSWIFILVNWVPNLCVVCWWVVCACCRVAVPVQLPSVNAHSLTHLHTHTYPRLDRNSDNHMHTPFLCLWHTHTHTHTHACRHAHTNRALVGLVWQAAPQKWVEVFCSLSLKLLTSPHPNLHWNIICLRCSKQLRTRCTNYWV